MTFQTETLGPAAAAGGRNIVSRAIAALGRTIANADRRRQDRREYYALMEFSDAHLRDIGLTRADVHALLLGRGEELRGRR